MSTIYDKPEDFGLEIVADEEYGEGYGFHKVVLWRKLSDGALLFDEDSGCSCPAPFESWTVEELTPLNEHTLGELEKLPTVYRKLDHRELEYKADFLRKVREVMNERR